MRRDAPLMCHSELITARWEARHALGARRDQATAREKKKKKTFLCIHEYNFSERWGEEQRARKLMTFPYLQVCCRVFRHPLVTGSKQEKQVPVAEVLKIRASYS